MYLDGDNKVEEVLSMRTRNTCTYAVKDEPGRFVLISQAAPMHYQDINGNWERFDLQFDSSNRLIKAPYSVELLADEIGYRGTDPTGKEIYLKMEGFYVEPEINGNKVLYKEVEPDVDFKLVFLKDKIKALRILKSENANPVAFYKSYREEGAKGHLINVGADDDMRPAKIGIKTEDTDNGFKRIRQEFENEVLIIDPKTRIRSWSKDIKYPVVIDPTSTFSIPNGTSLGGGNCTFFKNTFSTISNEFVSNAAFLYQTLLYDKFRIQKTGFAVTGVSTNWYTKIGLAGFPVSGIAQSSTINSATVKWRMAHFSTPNSAGAFYMDVRKASNPNIMSAVSSAAWFAEETGLGGVFWHQDGGTLGAATVGAIPAGAGAIQNFTVTNMIQSLVNSYDYTSSKKIAVRLQEGGGYGSQAIGGRAKLKSQPLTSPTCDVFFWQPGAEGTTVEPTLVIDYSAGGGPPASTYKPKIIFS